MSINSMTMAKVNKISSKDPNRLQTLESRYDRLLSANDQKQYVYSDKASRYINTIREIRTQINLRRVENQKANVNSPISQFLRQSKGMSGFEILTKSDLFNLTSPTLCQQ